MPVRAFPFALPTAASSYRFFPSCYLLPRFHFPADPTPSISHLHVSSPTNTHRLPSHPSHLPKMHFSTSISHTVFSLALLVLVAAIPAPHPIFEDDICNQACNAAMCQPGGYCDCNINDPCIGGDQTLFVSLLLQSPPPIPYPFSFFSPPLLSVTSYSMQLTTVLVLDKIANTWCKTGNSAARPHHAAIRSTVARTLRLDPRTMGIMARMGVIGLISGGWRGSAVLLLGEGGVRLLCLCWKGEGWVWIGHGWVPEFVFWMRMDQGWVKSRLG